MNATLHATSTLTDCVKILKEFVTESQLRMIWHNAMNGEEKAHFRGLLQNCADLIATMPKTYETDGQGKAAVAYLHFFRGGGDWYITEKDTGCPDEPGQLQAFGAADLGYGAELGYINIAELIAHGVELDLYWTPKPIGEIIA